MVDPFDCAVDVEFASENELVLVLCDVCLMLIGLEDMFDFGVVVDISNVEETFDATIVFCVDAFIATAASVVYSILIGWLFSGVAIDAVACCTISAVLFCPAGTELLFEI
jgi:hypothetical protein